MMYREEMSIIENRNKKADAIVNRFYLHLLVFGSEHGRRSVFTPLGTENTLPRQNCPVSGNVFIRVFPR